MAEDCIQMIELNRLYPQDTLYSLHMMVRRPLCQLWYWLYRCGHPGIPYCCMGPLESKTSMVSYNTGALNLKTKLLHSQNVMYMSDSQIHDTMQLDIKSRNNSSFMYGKAWVGGSF